MPQSLFAATRPGDLAVTIVDQPLIDFGPEIGGDLPNALRREWLVTNGLGGYASGTIAGVITRRYHGLLVATLAPPVERTVLVGGTTDWAAYAGERYALSTHEYADGTVDLHVGQSTTLVLSMEPGPDLSAEHALDAELTRQRALLDRAEATSSSPLVQQLVLA